MLTTDKSAVVVDVVIASLAHLVHQIPVGADRDHMETQAELLRQEAELQRRVFYNGVGAARLEWKADLVELATQARYPIDDEEPSPVADRVRDQLRLMCLGQVDGSECAGAIRQAIKMALFARRMRLGDVSLVVAHWEPLHPSDGFPDVPRRPILTVIDGGLSSGPPRIAKFR